METPVTEASAAIADATPTPTDSGITPEQETRIRDLFQEAYQVVYGDGKFQIMMDQAKNEGDPIQAVTLLVTGVVSSLIRDAGETDIVVLYAVATILAADLLEGVEEAGMPTAPGQMEQISAGIIEAVLTENPEFAQSVMANPEFQALQAQADGQGGAVEAVSEASGVPAAGLLQGAQTGQGV